MVAVLCDLGANVEAKTKYVSAFMLRRVLMLILTNNYLYSSLLLSCCMYVNCVAGKKGDTALRVAIQACHLEVVEVLLDKGAKIDRRSQVIDTSFPPRP